MYYEITEDANLDTLELVLDGSLFAEEASYSYIALYTPEALK